MSTSNKLPERIVFILDRRGEHLQEPNRWTDKHGEHLEGRGRWNDLKDQLKDFITMKQEFNSNNEFYLCDIGTKVGYYPPTDGEKWLPVNDRLLDQFFTQRNVVPVADDTTDLSEIFSTIEHKLNSGNNLLRLIVIYASPSSLPIVNNSVSEAFVQNCKPFVDVVYYASRDKTQRDKVHDTAWMWRALLKDLNKDSSPNKHFFSVANSRENLTRALAELLVHPDFRELPPEFQANPPKVTSQ